MKKSCWRSVVWNKGYHQSETGNCLISRQFSGIKDNPRLKLIPTCCDIAKDSLEGVMGFHPGKLLVFDGFLAEVFDDGSLEI